MDVCPSFGCRGSGAAQQRVSMAVCHLMSARNHSVLAYVDDFAGVHSTYMEAVAAFADFESLCSTLGLKIAPEKSAFPATHMEWLGFMFNTIDMTITIPPDKLQDIQELAGLWLRKASATRGELQVLAGKLNHVSLCILPARRFMSRILATLRSAPQSGYVPIDLELRHQVRWFVRYAEQFNGCMLLRPTLEKFVIECDACLDGAGAFSSTHYYDLRFPLAWSVDHHISRLEALNLIIALKSLIPESLRCTEIVIKTDNIASAFSLTSGRPKDPILAACARELWLVAALQQLTITIVHVPGESLVLADALSRRHKAPDFQQFVLKTVKELKLKPVTPVSCDYVLTEEL